MTPCVKVSLHTIASRLVAVHSLVAKTTHSTAYPFRHQDFLSRTANSNSNSRRLFFLHTRVPFLRICRFSRFFLIFRWHRATKLVMNLVLFRVVFSAYIQCVPLHKRSLFVLHPPCSKTSVLLLHTTCMPVFIQSTQNIAHSEVYVQYLRASV